jgi:DNA polymerase
MDLGANHISAEHLSSIMGWWQEAGFDTLTDDAPREIGRAHV